MLVKKVNTWYKLGDIRAIFYQKFCTITKPGNNRKNAANRFLLILKVSV